MIPYCPGPHELSVRPWPASTPGTSTCAFLCPVPLFPHSGFHSIKMWPDRLGV
ncbi:unnamed protein product, partial [Staurois parvus]